MSRSEFPAKVRAAAAERAKGHCESCGVKLPAGGFHYDHIKPDGLGGEPILANCAVLCLPCHKEKTFNYDNPIMAKADRQRKSIGQGIKTLRGRPFPKAKREIKRTAAEIARMRGEI